MAIVSLAAAEGALRALRECLSTEVERARGERVLLRTLDYEGLLRSAEEKREFVSRAKQLHDELMLEVRGAAAGFGLEEATIAGVARANPAARHLAEGASQVRALAEALAEIDALNRILCSKALSCVRGWLGALTDAPATYGRTGHVQEPALATLSRVL